MYVQHTPPSQLPQLLFDLAVLHSIIPKGCYFLTPPTHSTFNFMFRKYVSPSAEYPLE